MPEAKKDSVHTEKDTPLSPDLHAGILKEKEKKDIEGRIIDSIKRLGTGMTRKEIIALAERIEVSKGLDGLRMELEKELSKKQETLGEISEDALRAVLELFREAKEAAELGLKELKLDIRKINPSIDWEADASIHFSKRFPWVKRLEESELGKNIIVDISGFLTGSVDSAIAIVKILFALVQDIILLPAHIYRSIRK